MADERTVTYVAEIVVKRDGEELRLGPCAQGGSVGELAAHLVARAAALESETKDKLDSAEAEKGKRQRAELSGRRRRSWE
jgi:hypothetical protein